MSSKESVQGIAAYAIVAGCVWLGWQVLQNALIMRAPPLMALELASASPEVLRRASEIALAAEQPDQARILAEESLKRAPFNARALRVLGLVEARQGRTDLADELLTLAGNWSLRDDPAHAWLVENRLKRGDYRSAFAHADTLVRRREDIYPQVFRLFAIAGLSDPRSLPVLADLVAKNPPWRDDFLQYLHGRTDHLGVLANLAVLLQRTSGPLTQDELAFLYRDLIGAGQFSVVTEVRRRINRPASDALIQDGDFEDDESRRVLPFGWRTLDAPGASTQIVQDDGERGGKALRVEYNGFAQGELIEQMTLLRPGRYRLQGRWRSETVQNDLRVEWTMTCAHTNAPLQDQQTTPFTATSTAWAAFRSSFTVPSNCMAQWLRLSPVPGDRRTSIAIWFDDLSLTPETAVQAD